MKNHIAFIDQLRQQRLVGNRVHPVLKSGMILKRMDIPDAPRRKIIEDRDFVARQQQGLRQMRAQKPRSPRD